MPKTRWLSAAERQAWRNFSLMQFQLSALLGRELAPSGLSFQDYSVLAALSDEPDGQMRLVELGRGLGWEKSRISHHITRMEQRGLVARVRCPSDRRGWFVTMTEDGRKTIATAAPQHVATVRRQFIDLISAQQLATLDEIARTVLDHLPHEG
ncbi:MAG: MarR family winged helix-turn-helix transcriptional regulator [Acidimicrobiales bacterium]